MQNLGKKMGSKRSIFEEVSELETKSVNSNIKTGIIERSNFIASWAGNVVVKAGLPKKFNLSPSLTL